MLNKYLTCFLTNVETLFLCCTLITAQMQTYRIHSRGSKTSPDSYSISRTYLSAQVNFFMLKVLYIMGKTLFACRFVHDSQFSIGVIVSCCSLPKALYLEHNADNDMLHTLLAFLYMYIPIFCTTLRLKMMCVVYQIPYDHMMISEFELVSTFANDRS